MSGLGIVDTVREIKGWSRVDLHWVEAANTSAAILESFWKRLPIPRKDFIEICHAVGIGKWQEITQRSVSRFSLGKLRTKITDPEILKASLYELGLTVKTDAYVIGYQGRRVKADIVAVLEGEYDIG